MLNHLEDVNLQWNRPVPTLDHPADNRDSEDEKENGTSDFYYFGRNNIIK